jgi:putative GTP pyrophosphokinase
MRLYPETKNLHIETFKKEESHRAFDAYVAAEKNPERDAPRTQVVLVSVESLKQLREAYPNYFADAKAFVQAFEAAVKE